MDVVAAGLKNSQIVPEKKHVHQIPVWEFNMRFIRAAVDGMIRRRPHGVPAGGAFGMGARCHSIEKQGPSTPRKRRARGGLWDALFVGGATLSSAIPLLSRAGCSAATGPSAAYACCNTSRTTPLMILAGRGLNLQGLGASWVGELEAEDKISPVLATHASNGFLVIFLSRCGPGYGGAPWRSWTVSRFWENPDLLPGQLLVVGAYSAIWGLAAWDEVSYIMPASTEPVGGYPRDGVSGPPSPKPDPSEITWKWGAAGPETPARTSR